MMKYLILLPLAFATLIQIGVHAQKNDLNKPTSVDSMHYHLHEEDFRQDKYLERFIDAHERYREDLIRSRGSINEYENNVGSPSNFTDALNEYESNVGVIIYTFLDDTLHIHLLNKTGKVLESRFQITKDSIIDLANNVNTYFSNSNKRYPKKRGVKRVNNIDNVELKASYERVSSLLLPFSISILKEFDHLIIVPVLNLSIIPFGALKTSESSVLIDYMSYSIAPSLLEVLLNSDIANQQLGSRYGAEIQYEFNNALFVANPSYPENTNWVFPDLPGTLDEVNYILNYFKDSTYSLFVGEEATLENCMADICSYDLIYFATHGVSNDKNPLDSSFLVFSGVKESFLTARTIQSIRSYCKLNADLVVLSACQTGLGKAHEGGLIGLSRAFQKAGANHVLMSLWNINDSETATLMSFFFDALKKGGELMPHAALRESILRYRKEYSDDPNYWAAFSIFGTPY
jgi:CHAT domain-containing protein